MTFGTHRTNFTIYLSGVWWGWFNTQHVRSWRWGMFYIGPIGIGWQVGHDGTR